MAGFFTGHMAQPCAGERKIRSRLYKWWIFSLGVAIILFFMFFIGPATKRLTVFKQLAMVINEKNIETGMYFYTDVALFSEAERNIKNSMDFPPQQQ